MLGILVLGGREGGKRVGVAPALPMIITAQMMQRESAYDNKMLSYHRETALQVH